MVTVGLTVVVGPQGEDVAAEALRHWPKAEIHVQRERRGTAHAVLAARGSIERGADDILVTYADIPLIRAADARGRCAPDWRTGRRSSRWASSPRDPTGYGRLIERDGALDRDSRAQGRERGRARDPALQRRADGDRRRARDRAARGDRRRQRGRSEFYLPISSRSPPREASRAGGRWRTRKR